jgi:signal transduction histidine kinase
LQHLLTAADGALAWEILEQESPFDLMLCDLEMPRLDGFALLESMRKDPKHHNVPVLVVTSRDDLLAVDRAYDAGATSFTAKPINWRILTYQLRYMLRAADAQAELRAARNAAEDAANLKRNLLTLIQHETRTPLNTIIGNCEILEEMAADPSFKEFRSGATQVAEAAWRLERTLSRVIYLSQLSSGSLTLDPEELRVSTLVEEATVGLRSRAAAAGSSLQLAAAPTDPLIACDLQSLTRALNELIVNALTHGGAGSPIELSWHAEHDEVAIIVHDAGPGLSQPKLNLWREPLSQLPNVLTGRDGALGIGLTTARLIAELHGGRLELSSEMRRGTTVRLILPCAISEREDNYEPQNRAAGTRTLA